MVGEMGDNQIAELQKRAADAMNKKVEELLYGTSTAPPSASGTLTVESMLAAIKEVKAAMPPPLTRIVESSLALEQTDEPVKRHKFRLPFGAAGRKAAGSDRYGRYHLRIQKKWNKRFGFKTRSCAYRTPFGMIVHPALVEQVRRQLPKLDRNEAYLGVASPWW